MEKPPRGYIWNANTLGEKLINQRLIQGLTQKAAARKYGVCVDVYRRLERRT